MWRNLHRVPSAVLLCLALAACSGDDSADGQAAQTQRERDSIIGQSRLPGAGGVRGATAASDSAAARQRRLDSIAEND
jgi:hypothetical protein